MDTVNTVNTADTVDAAKAPGVGRRMWHVTLTVAGDAIADGQIKDGLEKLARERPFLLTGRYARDRAEVRYWEEAESLQDAAALALRLWGEHRCSAGLPLWQIVGLEVLERDVFHLRAINGEMDVRLARAGAVRPF
jgi:hypothetical protein